MTMTEVWDANQLMGLAAGESATDAGAADTGKRGSVVVKGKGVDDDPMMWGIPGHLTKEETDTYFKFKEEVEKRAGDFRDTVYCFGEIEGECWALCRWLRARKFVLVDVIKMIEEATQVRSEAKKRDFYPDPRDALGVDSSLFFAQYPQLYTGHSKNGALLYISKPGILNVDGMECITTLDGIIKFHWHVMMLDFKKRLYAQKEKDPENFKRFECFCILDLDNLTTSQLSSRALAIIKEQSAIDSICFPETMSKMLIVNAPAFFAATWRLIKGWLDPRTANKIEVISNKAAGEKRLLELVESEQLPCDYGGTGKHTNDILMESYEGEAKKLDCRMLYLRGHGTELVEVGAEETLDIEVYTRSTAGAKFTIYAEEGKKKEDLCPTVEVKHNGTDDTSEPPTFAKINSNRIEGPRKVKIKVDSNAGRFSRHNYLLVFYHYAK